MNSDEISNRYSDWLSAVNRRDWAHASAYLAASIIYNGQTVTSAEYLAVVQETLLSCPDDTVHLDMLVIGTKSDQLAARLIHQGTLTKPFLGGPVTGRQIEWPEISFVWLENGLISRIQSLPDTDILRQGIAKVPRHPDSPIHPPAEADLDAKYRDYISAINTHTMAERFPKHCHQHLTHNTRELSLDQYWRFIEDSFDEIQGLTFTIAELVADHGRQRVAARLEFSGKPVTEFRGIQPSGKEVLFWEHVLYQYDGGKIARVWSTLDLEAYRACLEG